MKNLLLEIELSVKDLDSEIVRAEKALRLIRTAKNNSFKYHIEHYAEQGVNQLIAEYEKRLFYTYSIDILEHFLSKDNFDTGVVLKKKKDRKIYNLALTRLNEIVTRNKQTPG